VCFNLISHSSCSFDSHLLDFAEYTSAKARIPLGKKARKMEASKHREEMQDLIADAFVSFFPSLGWLRAHSHQGRSR
jgi:GC-rich sequence DNA-binding factor